MFIAGLKERDAKERCQWMMKLRNHQPSSQLDDLIPDPLSPFVDNDGDERQLLPALLICRTRKSSGMFVKGSYPSKTKSYGGLPCEICGSYSIQDDCNIYLTQNDIPVTLLWNYMDSACLLY
ncbi:hypothetical protein HanPSC8_Chr04g0145341 [Helianthus annuus]|nr:hypothetical protein HanPSC8_Chr04g0145341 [Helianthus annuus]